MNNSIINTKENVEYLTLISDLIENSTVQEMNNYRQHYDESCFSHCLEVSYVSYLICKKLNLDYVSSARAGLLHDLFLYDWRDSRKALNLEKYHAFIHPQIALDNSLKLFDLNKREQDIIVKHMWPVTFFHFPRYKESFIITLVDKYSALNSSRKYYLKHLKQNKIYRYAYIFLVLFFVRF